MKLSTMKLTLPLPSSPSTRSVEPTATPASPAPATDSGTAIAGASASAHYGPNPLWIITAALALFFAVAAAFLSAGGGVENDEDEPSKFARAATQHVAQCRDANYAAHPSGVP